MTADDWQDRAACVGLTAIMYPGRGQDTAPAKRICAGCPLDVRQACADSELFDWKRHIYGVRAGMTIDERRNRKTGDPVPDPIVIRRFGGAAAPCGSRRAAQRHRDNGEPLCVMCANAEALAVHRALARRQAQRAAVA